MICITLGQKAAEDILHGNFVKDPHPLSVKGNQAQSSFTKAPKARQYPEVLLDTNRTWQEM